MCKPHTSAQPLHGAADQIMSAMSALHMPPEPVYGPLEPGAYLSDSDHMVRHALEHLRAALDYLRAA